MASEKITCLKDVISELSKLNETLIRSDSSYEKYVPPGHGFKFKKGKKEQTVFELKIKNEEIYGFDLLYLVECNDGCGETAHLYCHEMPKKNKIYRVHGYPTIDKNGSLIIVSGEEYLNFQKRLSSFARTIIF